MASLKSLQSSFLKLTISKPASCLCPCYISIRWKKPRWLPRAPSKEFYVREPTPVDPVINEELKWRYEEYRHSVAAIRQHLAQELQAEEEQKIKAQISEEQEWNDMVRKVKAWNENVAMFREKRLLEEELKEEQKKVEMEKNQQAHILKMMTEAEEKVDFEKKQKFITLENLDEEIEKILDVNTDYEYAIDNAGFRHTRDGPEKLPEKDSKTALSPS